MKEMKLVSKTAVLAALLIGGSASAMAAQGLTPQECNDYPFKPLKGEVTHAQLMRELGELEAVGYDPTADDANYPDDLDQAQEELQAEYRADCTPAAPMTSAQGPGSAAPSQAPGNPAG
jgi:hypothetical protein